MPEPSTLPAPDHRTRCPWVAGAPDLVAYHDDEWGRPVADDVRLFEKLSLETFQAGLSWRTIYNKRPAFRRAFAGFDWRRVAAFDDADVARLAADAGIVRNRAKIAAVIHNAGLVPRILDAHGSLAAFIWRFEPGPADRPRHVTWEVVRELAETPASRALSKALRRAGWRFFGPTTAYATMQAMGLVNDHVEGCACRARITAARRAFRRPG